MPARSRIAGSEKFLQKLFGGNELKIISLLGSPHGLKGNTARLLQVVLQGAEALGAQNETIILKGNTVRPCQGCDACHKKGSCRQKDDFESIKQKIFAADGLILASPNYIFSVSAQLKAFMDRCCGVIHCLGFEGKYGAAVVTSGGGDEAPIAEYMNHFLMTTGIMPVGSVWATMGTLTGDDFPHEIRERSISLGENLVSAWKNKARPADTVKAMDAFHNRMKTLIQYRKEEWPYEYDYWVNHHDLGR
jgi:multimeric flavodoxin WrbA